MARSVEWTSSLCCFPPMSLPGACPIDLEDAAAGPHKTCVSWQKAPSSGWLSDLASPLRGFVMAAGCGKFWFSWLSAVSVLAQTALLSSTQFLLLDFFLVVLVLLTASRTGSDQLPVYTAGRNITPTCATTAAAPGVLRPCGLHRTGLLPRNQPGV